MGTIKKLAKSGMFGLAGLAATNKDVVNKIARNGGLGLVGMALAKKKAPQGAGGMRGRPVMEDIMTAEQVPVNGAAPIMGGRPGTMGDSGEDTQQFKRGGKVKKMAKGGSASRRADGCATQGKTKGRFV